MRDLLTALALMLVFEGVLLALFSDRLHRIAERLAPLPSSLLRAVGLGAATVGVFAVWLIRGG